MLPGVLERVERGDSGDPQDESEASYFRFFEPEYAWIDWSRAGGRDRAPGSGVALPLRRPPATAAPSRRSTVRRVRVLRVSRDPAEGAAMACGDGTLWIVETEAP